MEARINIARQPAERLVDATGHRSCLFNVIRSSKHSCLFLKRLIAVSAMLIPLSAASGFSIAGAKLAAKSSVCKSAQPFYWEIGAEAGKPIASGQVGDGALARETPVLIASASKWTLGAYVIERYNGVPTNPLLTKNVTMQAGFAEFTPVRCNKDQTVAECFNSGRNSKVKQDLVGHFAYNGGNSQNLAADPSLLNLGAAKSADLTAEIGGSLNLGSSFRYVWPVLGMGMEANAKDYAAFLQKLMPDAKMGYKMRQHLGLAAVETIPCPSSTPNCTPMGTVAWRYAFHYWIEDNEKGGRLPSGAEIGPGDGAYSSPGMFGFYPWIKQGTDDKWYYGIISRKGPPNGYEQSLICGQAIRSAFFKQDN